MSDADIGETALLVRAGLELNDLHFTGKLQTEGLRKCDGVAE